jgi:hypothetical protein
MNDGEIQFCTLLTRWIYLVHRINICFAYGLQRYRFILEGNFYLGYVLRASRTPYSEILVCFMDLLAVISYPNSSVFHNLHAVRRISKATYVLCSRSLAQFLIRYF